MMFLESHERSFSIGNLRFVLLLTNDLEWGKCGQVPQRPLLQGLAEWFEVSFGYRVSFLIFLRNLLEYPLRLRALKRVLMVLCRSEFRELILLNLSI